MKYIVTDDKKIIKIRLSLGTSELVNNYRVLDYDK
jgi:hypothetical protein